MLSLLGIAMEYSLAVSCFKMELIFLLWSATLSIFRTWC